MRGNMRKLKQTFVLQCVKMHVLRVPQVFIVLPPLVPTAVLFPTDMGVWFVTHSFHTVWSPWGVVPTVGMKGDRLLCSTSGAKLCSQARCLYVFECVWLTEIWREGCFPQSCMKRHWCWVWAIHVSLKCDKIRRVNVSLFDISSLIHRHFNFREPYIVKPCFFLLMLTTQLYQTIKPRSNYVRCYFIDLTKRHSLKRSWGVMYFFTVWTCLVIYDTLSDGKLYFTCSCWTGFTTRLHF